MEKDINIDMDKEKKEKPVGLSQNDALNDEESVLAINIIVDEPSKEETKTKKKKETNYLHTKMHVSTLDWYLTFMIMNIPFIGFIYFLIISFASKSIVRKKFARAFILYEISLIAVCLLLGYALFRFSLPYIEALLDYIEML